MGFETFISFGHEVFFRMYLPLALELFRIFIDSFMVVNNIIKTPIGLTQSNILTVIIYIPHFIVCSVYENQHNLFCNNT